MNAITNVRDIHNVEDLIGYFAGKLGWNIDVDGFYSIDDFSYELEAEDIGLAKGSLEKIKYLKLLRPFDEHQRWGMFCLAFEDGFLEIGALRKVVSGLVRRKRKDATAGVWNCHDLLFLCEWGEAAHRTVAIAYFEERDGRAPVVKVIRCPWTIVTDPKQFEIFESRISKLAWPEDEVDAVAWLQAWSEAFSAVSLVEEVVDILANSHYISWRTLCWKLGIPGKCKQQKDELYEQLEAEASRHDARLGVVSSQDAENAVISEKVVYSTEWERGCPDVGCVNAAEKIGLDLYAIIMRNNLLLKGYKGKRMPDYGALRERDLNYIIGTQSYFGEQDFSGMEFQAKYAQKYLELEKRRRIAEAERYDLTKVNCGGELYLKAMNKYFTAQFMCGEAHSEYMKSVVDDLEKAEALGSPLAKYELGKLCAKRNPELSQAYYRGATPGLKVLADAGSKEAIKCLVELGVEGYVIKKEDRAKMTKESLLFDFYYDWECPTRLVNTLNREKIETVGQFLEFSTPEHMQSIKGFGKKSAEACLELREDVLKHLGEGSSK